MSKYKVIQVQFDGYGKNYSYYTDFEVQPRDVVVVFARGDLALARVTQTIGLSRSALDKAKSLVVCKVAVGLDYEDRFARLCTVLEIKNQLREMREAASEYDVFMNMAKDNPEVAGLLNRLSELDDSIPKLPASTEADDGEKETSP